MPWERFLTEQCLLARTRCTALHLRLMTRRHIKMRQKRSRLKTPGHRQKNFSKPLVSGLSALPDFPSRADIRRYITRGPWKRLEKEEIWRHPPPQPSLGGRE